MEFAPAFLLLLAEFVVSEADYDGPWRKTLVGTCWTDSACRRAMTVSHGGDWNAVTAPYDSMPAFEAAWNNGADAVKGDFRVTRDGEGVIVHSSPFELYETVGCAGRRVEDMTVAQVTRCKMAPTQHTFITAAQLLGWAAGRVNVMLCVKNDTDIPRAISTLLEANATDRAFLEIRTGAMLSLVPLAPDYEAAFYLPELGSATEVMQILGAPERVLQRSFMLELDPGYAKWRAPDGTAFNATDTIARTLHPRGVRALAASNDIKSGLPSVKNHLQLFEAGFDVVYTYNLAHAVKARIAINTQRGIVPP
eukprot:g3611.t1